MFSSASGGMWVLGMCLGAPSSTSGDGHPVSLGTGFELHKPKGDRDLHAVCSLQTHMLGWEVVLEVNGLLSRSPVCRSRDEVLGLCEQWRAVMVEIGWR